MHFLQIYFIFVCFNICDVSNQNYDYYEKHNLRNSWRSITPSRNIQDSHNVTVYLGYANNPFGPSIRMLPTKEMIDSSVQTPLFNQIKFKPTDNVVNSEHYKITHQEQRSKRGVVHLYNMVSCATGCNPLIYKGYGCYCGFLGSGYAVDGIDRCCKWHDWCYDTARCPMFLEYLVPYFWKCYNNRPLCSLNHGLWGGPGSCAQRLCECDRVLSECLSQYPCPTSRAFCTSSPWRLLQNLF